MSDLRRSAASATRDLAHGVLSVVVTAVLWLVCFTYIFPFVWLLYTSFKTHADFTLNIFRLPSPPVGDNYRDIFTTSDVYVALFNSAFNAAVSMALINFFAFTVAYFLARYTFRGRNFLYAFFLIGMLVPIHGLLIPVYIQFNALGLTNHRYTLIVPYVTFALPTAIYLYDSYIRTIPRSIEEAAFVDGATTNQLMATVMFPICLPITGTVLILNFLNVWNEFPFALVLASGMGLRTVPIWLTTFQGQYTANIPLRLTAMFIACLPIIVAYLFLRDKIMQGMAAGAIKG